MNVARLETSQAGLKSKKSDRTAPANVTGAAGFASLLQDAQPGTWE